MSALSKLTTTPSSLLKPSSAASSLSPKPKQKEPSSGRGILVCLLGAPGVGKSSVLAQFPNCEFIVDKRDQGILDLIDYKRSTGVKLSRDAVTVCDNYMQMRNALEVGITGDASTLVIESLVGIQSFCDDYCMVQDYGHPQNPKAGNQFANYRNGFVLSANVWFQALVDLMVQGQNNGKNIFLTGHSRVGTAKSIKEEDWVAQVMQNTPELSRRVEATFATILHIGQHTSVSKPVSKLRADGVQTYTLYTELNPFFPAKNRMGLHGEFEYPDNPLDAYQLFCKLMQLDPSTGKRK